MPRTKTNCSCGARRLPSFGSVDYRPKSDTHYIRYRVDGEDQPSKSFDTHDEACDFLEQLAIDARRGKGMPNRRKGEIPFERVADEWLNAKLKTTDNPQTADKCRSAVAWSKRGLAGHPVGSITTEQIQDFYNDCCQDEALDCDICEELRYVQSNPKARCRKHQRKPMKPSTLTSYRNYLHQIFDLAVRKGYLHNGSPASTKLQKLPPAEERMICLDFPESDHLLGTVREQFPKDYALVHTALHTAGRIGELFALPRNHVRLDGAEPHILIEESRRKDGTLKETKTRKRRRVDLFPCCVAVLAEHLASHDSAFVFPSQTGGTQSTDNWRNRHWYQIVQATGFTGDKAELHIHDLRHTHISQLLMRNWPVLVVSQRAGHASAKMTLDRYGHVIPGSQRLLISQMASSFGGDPFGGDQGEPPLRLAR